MKKIEMGLLSAGVTLMVYMGVPVSLMGVI